MKVLIALALLFAIQSDPVRELQDVRRAAFRKKTESASARLAAHEALDRGEYETATGLHRKSTALEAEIRDLRRKEADLVPIVVKALLNDLTHDEIAVRERAVSRLVFVGPAAIPLVKAVREGADAEIRSRLDLTLSRLGNLDVDEEGRLKQWADLAVASTQYSAEGCAAKQATGKPDTMEAGDKPTAWAAATPDAGEEWIELTYAVEVRPLRVRIRETCAPGAVVKLEMRDANGAWLLLWKGVDPTRECPGWFDVPFDPPPGATRVVRITLDTAAVAGWNEIDAVELIGELPAPAKK